MWHVSSRSGVATLRTAIHLLLIYTRPLAWRRAAQVGMYDTIRDAVLTFAQLLTRVCVSCECVHLTHAHFPTVPLARMLAWLGLLSAERVSVTKVPV